MLDTNVVSELMRPVAASVIASWVADRATSSLYLTAIAFSRGMAVATRNVRDFADTGIEVIGP